MNTQIIKKNLSEYFSMQKEVKFAYLFGSYAKDSVSKLSDIDVAVYLDDLINDYKRFEMRLIYIRDIKDVLNADKLDLIILNDSPLLLRFSVVKDGVIVGSKDETKRIEFETKTMSMYFDEEYYYKRHSLITLDRIAKGGIL